MSMSKQATPQLKTVSTQGQWEGGYRTALQVRQFSAFYTAEPEKIGGDNSAPTPMEYVLASFNGCIAIVIEMVARELSFDLQGMQLKAEGYIDQRGLLGTADVSPHFQEVHSFINFRTPEGPERLEELKAQVLRRCPAYNLLKDAGIPIHLHWTLNAGEEPGREQ